MRNAINSNDFVLFKSRSKIESRNTYMGEGMEYGCSYDGIIFGSSLWEKAFWQQSILLI